MSDEDRCQKCHHFMRSHAHIYGCTQCECMPEPTKDQSHCDIGQHAYCTGYTLDELDPETCDCTCHDPVDTEE